MVKSPAKRHFIFEIKCKPSIWKTLKVELPSSYLVFYHQNELSREQLMDILMISYPVTPELKQIHVSNMPKTLRIILVDFMDYKVKSFLHLPHFSSHNTEAMLYVEAILVNIFGGIVNCAIIANGITKACQELELKVPLVVRLEGTNVHEAQRILSESGLPITSASDLEDAAKKAVASVAKK
ncbi:hypothetical protein DUI87_24540 [Hirundo rustica rustica]|uniref:ATP-citrate synthase/succinyl-CoA ligase C-terminal domain-containing protein n=1 Tax=Hirundo rustica rustica TaxID=333673 RepID=A0A3M0JDD3_HIRRU|nr:hypothetical protein DUI87_24540 [Hirundo rustica rustica]